MPNRSTGKRRVILLMLAGDNGSDICCDRAGFALAPIDRHADIVDDHLNSPRGE